MAFGTIEKVSGPLVTASGLSGAKIHEICKVSDKGLIGEIIEIKKGWFRSKYTKKQRESDQANPWKRQAHHCLSN